MYIRMPKARLGGKITDSHTTSTETAAVVIDVLSKLDEVTKISLGSIRHIGGGERRLKVAPITGGIKIAVRGSGAVQDLFVYTSNPLSTEKKLENIFS